MHYRPPKAFAAKPGEDFRSWKMRLEHYFTLADIPEDKKKEVMLLNLEGIAYRTAEKIKAATALNYTDSIKILMDHFSVIENKSEFRMKFSARDMKPEESYETYSQVLRLLAAEAFPDFEHKSLDELVIQRFIKGIQAPVTSQRVFLRECVTVTEAVQYAKMSEAAFLFARPQRTTTGVVATVGDGQGPSTSQNNYVNNSNSNSNLNYNSNRGRGNARGGRGNYGNSNVQVHTIQCNCCHKFGHTAIQCWHNKSNSAGSKTTPQAVNYTGKSNQNRSSYQSAFQQIYETTPSYNRNAANREVYANRGYGNRGGRGNYNYTVASTMPQIPENTVNEQYEAELAMELAHYNMNNAEAPAGQNFFINYQPNRAVTRTTTAQNAQITAINHQFTRSMFVTGEINAVPAKYILLDTGSSVSLISAMLWHECKQNNRVYQALNGQFITANGSPLDTLGQADVRIKLAGLNVLHTVVIARSLAQHCILGTDFLLKHGCDLLLRIHTLCTPQGRTEIRFEPRAPQTNVIVYETQTGTGRAFTEQTEVIPPQSEKFISCTHSAQTDARQNLFTEVSKTAAQISELDISDAVVPNTCVIPVRIINWSAVPITIPARTHIANVNIAMPTQTSAVNQVMQTNQSISAATLSKTLSLKDECIVKAVQQTDASLTIAQKAQFAKLLTSYSDVISSGLHDVGCTPVIKMHINTGQAAPIKQAPRRIPYCYMPEVNKELAVLEQTGIISKGESSWASPIVIVRKKTGEIRICVDYRKLNAVTIKDAYPLPRVDDLLDALSGSAYFSSLDLASGYFNVEVAEEDKPKTAFCTPFNTYIYNRMPFGLSNAVAVFQRLMTAVLGGLIGHQACAYLDDVIIFSKTFEEHIARLQNVLQRFRETKLKIKLSKCSFCASSVQFLGHVVDKNGIRPDKTKISKIVAWPEPKGLDEVRSFLGFANYYRRFVHNYAQISKPLARLMEKDAPFEWTDECSRSFKSLKLNLSTTPILAYPKFDKPFILDTDASGYAIGAVLSQIDDSKVERPIAFFSRLLSKPEQNYSVTRKELLAMIDAMEQYRVYLLGKKFLVRTDHSALKWLHSFKEPTGQVARWLERLAEFDYIVEHRAGRLHGNADALSRYPINSVEVIGGHSAVVSLTTIIERQKADTTLMTVRSWLEKDERPLDTNADSLSREERFYWAKFNLIKCENAALYLLVPTDNETSLEPRLIIPKSLQLIILRAAHDQPGSGHLSVKKMFAKLRERFYWWKMRETIESYTRACTACSHRKIHRKSHAALHPIRTGWPFQRIGIDFVGPLPVTERGNKFILVVIDYFTRWCEAFAMSTMDAGSTAHILVTQVFARFGMPYIIHSDQGRNFESVLLKNIYDRFEIARTRTTSYHPQCNGMTERLNRTLAEMLATSSENAADNWDELLDFQLLAYRSSVNVSTGYTPHFLLFGYEIKLPLDCIMPTPDQKREEMQNSLILADKYHLAMLDAFENARSNMNTAQKQQQTVYDRRLFGQRFKINDKVWLHEFVKPAGISFKFWRPWSGPWTIKKQISDVDYKVLKDGTNKQLIVHFDRLRKCHALPRELTDAVPDADTESDTDSETETITIERTTVPIEYPVVEHSSSSESDSDPDEEHEFGEPGALPVVDDYELTDDIASAPSPDTAYGTEESTSTQTQRTEPQPSTSKAAETVARHAPTKIPRAPRIGYKEMQRQKAVHDTERKPEATQRYGLRAKIKAPSQYKDYSTAILPAEIQNSNSNLNSKIQKRSKIRNLTLMQMLALIVIIIFACMDDTQAQGYTEKFNDDLLVIPQLGIMAERCGKIALQENDLSVSMVFRIPHLNAFIFPNISCDGIDASNSFYANYKLTVGQWLNQESQLPGWYLEGPGVLRLRNAMRVEGYRQRRAGAAKRLVRMRRFIAVCDEAKRR